MPQLDPSPWLVILLLTWLVLIAIILPKVTAYTNPNEPNPQSTKPLEVAPWDWQWS